MIHEIWRNCFKYTISILYNYKRNLKQSLVDGNPLWRHFSGRLWVGDRQYTVLQVSFDVRFL